MIRMNDVISIIVKDNETGKLERLVYDCELEKSPSEAELRRGFNFCAGPTSTFASCLPVLNYRQPLTNESDRQLALAHEQTMARIRKKHPDLLAFSHRQGGWKTFEWQFNADIKFQVRTNFGYGNSSYFFLLNFYKGYQLTPYSYYVRYRYAQVADICRYTNSYPVQYSAWRDAMLDTISFYNAVVLQQDTHVLNWIKGHLKGMLDGLESYLTNQQGADMDTFVESRGKSIRLSGEDWFVVKTEKIAGSMQFIANMRALPAEIPVNAYIDRLVDINRRFMPQLLERIQQVAEKMQKLKAQLDDEIVLDHYPLYQVLDKKYWSKNKCYTDAGRRKTMFLLMRMLRRFQPDYNYRQLKADLHKLKVRIDSINDLKTRIYHAESLHTFLVKSKDQMDGYMKDITESDKDK